MDRWHVAEPGHMCYYRIRHTCILAVETLGCSVQRKHGSSHQQPVNKVLARSGAACKL